MAKTRSGQKRRAASAQAAARAKAKAAQAADGTADGSAEHSANGTANGPAKGPIKGSTKGPTKGTGKPPASSGRPTAPVGRRPGRPLRPGLLDERSPLGRAGARLGVPPLGLLLGGASWLLALVVWGVGGVGGGFAVFLGALLSAGVATGFLLASVARGKGLLGAARAGVVLGLAVAIPVVFDPHTGDVFNLPRYTLVAIGALVLAGLTAVAAVHERRVPAWRNGLQWPLAAVVLWTIVAALSSVDVNVSLLGDYGSYDGLYGKLAFATVLVVAAGILAAKDVRRVLGVLALAGGGVVTLYGFIQLHDTTFGGGHWDFIAWHDTSFANQIFSTFGNPNHLGGFLAIILPAVAVLAFTARRRWLQVAGVVFGLVVLLEILRTAARGAWVAVMVSGVVLLVALTPELKRHKRLAFGGLGGLVVVAAGGMAALGHRLLHVPLSSLFVSTTSSPVGQRFQIWQQAIHMATNHPVTGIGPDTFPLVYPQYQTATWVKGLGPNYFVNGGHDILMNVLADQGFVGLVLFLVLLTALALRGIGAWRRLRATERAGEAEGEVAEAATARDRRLLLAAVGAGITTYLVQALFNVQQVGLSFSFWLLAALLLVLARAAGVPDTLRPAALVSPASAGYATDGPADDLDEAPARTGRRRRGAVPWATVLTAAAATALVAVLSLGADGPWRADHAYWAANVELQALGKVPSSSGSAKAQQLSNAYRTDVTTAMTLNPWEPTYPAAEGAVLAASASRASNKATESQDLVQAQHLYAQAHADVPLEGQSAYNLAIVDIDLARVDKSGSASYLASAVAAAEVALRDNPRDTSYAQLLTTLRQDQKSGALNS